MKRFALLVSALAMTATAHAQDATEIKNGGEFRLRYENFFNKSFQDADTAREQHVDSRLKWNVNVRRGEKLQANVSLLHNARFGGGSPTDNGVPANQVEYQSGDNNSVVVNRAWGWWRATDAVAFKVGRIGIDFADGAVFSENDWQPVSYAHEGLNVAFDTSFAMFNVYAVKLAELARPAGQGQTDPEANYYMATMDLKNMPEAIKTANVHAIAVVGDATGVSDGTGTLPTAAAQDGAQNWQHVGATVGGDVIGIMYKGTVAFQFGDIAKAPDGDTSLSANMFDLMVGYGLPEVMGFKISAGYHQDSGTDAGSTDNKTYQTLFYDRHNYAGLMDVVNWGNLTYWNVNASITPTDDIEVGLGYYMFNKTEAAGGTNFGYGAATRTSTIGGTQASTVATGGTSDDLGSEVDVFVNKTYGNDFKIGVRYSAFMPGDAIKQSTTPEAGETAHMAFLQTAFTF